jgi:hypothetical protein
MLLAFSRVLISFFLFISIFPFSFFILLVFLSVFYNRYKNDASLLSCLTRSECTQPKSPHGSHMYGAHNPLPTAQAASSQISRLNLDYAQIAPYDATSIFNNFFFSVSVLFVSKCRRDVLSANCNCPVHLGTHTHTHTHRRTVPILKRRPPYFGDHHEYYFVWG